MHLCKFLKKSFWPGRLYLSRVFQAYFDYVMLRKGKGMIGFGMLKSKALQGLEIGENTCKNL